MKANKFFNENMTSDEARIVFFRKFDEAKTVEEVEELRVCYNAVASVICRRELEMQGRNNRYSID